MSANIAPEPWTRPKPRPRPAPSKPTALTIFYGVNADVIAQVCAVSSFTARCYKRGTRKPSAQAVRLLQLHLARRVLGSEWIGWRIHGGELVSPEGWSVNQSQLRGWSVLMQLMAHWSKESTERQREYDHVIDIMEGLAKRA
jgi:hypothetical protein